MSLAYSRKTAELQEKAFSAFWARELVELHGGDISSEGDGGVALGFEEVLNKETVPISANLYSCFCGEFCHISHTFSLCQGEEQWGGEQPLDTGGCHVQLS